MEIGEKIFSAYIRNTKGRKQLGAASTNNGRRWISKQIQQRHPRGNRHLGRPKEDGWMRFRSRDRPKES
jgi:hypothetical protein